MRQKQAKTPVGENLLTLRHRMKMTQGEFIDMFFKDERGVPLLSVAKLSNLETKGNRDEELLAGRVARRLSVDPALFLLPNKEFAQDIDDFIEKVAPRPAAGVRPAASSRVEGVLDALSDYLVENISLGKLQPGSRLLSDRAFSEMLGLPRSSVREALKVLGAMGIIDILPGSGMYLAKDPSGIFTLPFSWTFLLSTDSNQSVYQLRMALERETVRLATQRRESPTFAPIRRAVDREKHLLAQRDFPGFLACDQEFHMGIAACADSEILYNLLLTCRKILAFLNAYGMSTLEQMTQVQSEHEELCCTMEAGQTEKAEKLIVEHLIKSEERYKKGKEKRERDAP